MGAEDEVPNTEVIRPNPPEQALNGTGTVQRFRIIHSSTFSWLRAIINQQTDREKKQRTGAHIKIRSKLA